MSPPGTPTLASPAYRAEFARQLAKRLMELPFVPEPGEAPEAHAANLETSFAREILDALNQEVLDD